MQLRTGSFDASRTVKAAVVLSSLRKLESCLEEIESAHKIEFLKISKVDGVYYDHIWE